MAKTVYIEINPYWSEGEKKIKNLKNAE